MKIMKLNDLLFAASWLFIASSASATNLVKFYTDAESDYYLVPPNKIKHFQISKEDDELLILLDGYVEVDWRFTIEDITEKKSLEIINKIYSDTRSEVLTVKIDSIE